MGRKIVTTFAVAAVLAITTWAYPSERPSYRAEASPASSSRAIPAPATAAVITADPQGTLTAIDPLTNNRLYKARSGVLSPTKDRVYAQLRRSIRIFDATTGDRLGRAPRPAGMVLQVASSSGHRLAFTPPVEHGRSAWLPLGRSRTQITIVSTDTGRAKRFDLKGNFGIEAFATDDRELFLIEYMPAKAPWHYGLRRLDLATGAVKEIDRAKQGAPGAMDGTGRLALFSPAGDELYTLYTQQGANYTHVEPDKADPDEVYAFVHLLNLDGAWTHCIDLPAPFGTGAATTHAMALSDDGERLYVADPSSGGLAVIDTTTALVVNSATADLRSLRDGASAAVGANGILYLQGKSSILAFDGVSLELIRTIEISAHPGIAVSGDGSMLYVGRGSRLLALDATTGRRLQSMTTERALTVVTGL